MIGPRRGHFIDIGGVRAHVHAEGGTGPPVLLLHGCGSLGEEMLPAFAATPLPFRLFAIDRPGYGFSDPLPPGSEGADGQAGWIGRVLDALGLARVTIVAHSLGSAPALLFAAAHPERAAGVLLMAPFCRPTPHAAVPLLRAFLAPVVGPLIREHLIPLLAPLIGPSMLASAIRPDDVPGYLEDFPFAHAGHPGAVRAMAAELLAFNACMEGAEDALAALDVPVHVVHGTADRIAEPDWHLPWLAGQLRSVRMEMLESVGHAPHHARPAQVHALLADLAA